MVKVKDPKIRRWGRAIRDFSARYETSINKYIDEQVDLASGNKYGLQGSFETKKEVKEEELSMPSGPFIQLKSSFRGHENHLVEVVLNESLLEILGFTVDSFVSRVFQQGLPQIFQLVSSTNSQFIQTILEHYSGASFSNHHTPSYQSSLVMKNGDVRTAKVEACFSMHNEDGRYGSDTTFIFSNYEKPCSLSEEDKWALNINKESLVNLDIKKEESESFLFNQYSSELSSLYPKLEYTSASQESEQNYKVEEV